ncbi:hypothetical protein BDR06DRAFT_762767 [Suillus hirtellus]|nr:hypothetical protein BDR06DRAFT_762767 [Suillus hirtellus]
MHSSRSWLACSCLTSTMFCVVTWAGTFSSSTPLRLTPHTTPMRGIVDPWIGQHRGVSVVGAIARRCCYSQYICILSIIGVTWSFVKNLTRPLRLIIPASSIHPPHFQNLTPKELLFSDPKSSLTSSGSDIPLSPR